MHRGNRSKKGGTIPKDGRSRLKANLLEAPFCISHENNLKVYTALLEKDFRCTLDRRLYKAFNLGRPMKKQWRVHFVQWTTFIDNRKSSSITRLAAKGRCYFRPSIIEQRMADDKRRHNVHCLVGTESESKNLLTTTGLQNTRAATAGTQACFAGFLWQRISVLQGVRQTIKWNLSSHIPCSSEYFQQCSAYSWFKTST